MVDAKYRFVWGSCGFPGNSQDSILFRSTGMWEKLKNNYAADICVNVGGMMLPPMIFGHSASLCDPHTKLVVKTIHHCNFVSQAGPGW